MLGKTHMAVGIAATLAITQPSGVSELVLAVGAGSLGALISDIDVGTSNSHRDADKITALSVVVVLAVFAMDYFCRIAAVYRDMCIWKGTAPQVIYAFFSCTDIIIIRPRTDLGESGYLFCSGIFIPSCNRYI